MHVVVATHGHCFDGLASATLFTSLIRALEPNSPSFSYRACGYGANQQKPTPALLNGDENAILDYRYYGLPKLNWYFDHHRTAFASSADRDAFAQSRENGRMFFDPAYGSCARLIADVARETFGHEQPNLAELVRWAETIDTAGFATPEEAIDRSNPILRLASVIEHYGDDAFVTTWVPRLLERPLAEIAALPEIAQRYRPLGDKHQRFVERVKQSLERRGRVVFVDLTTTPIDSVGKFVTYALCPESVYSVIVALMSGGVKISVGYNPWSGQALDTDISAICARWGGGGHSVVGGIAFKTSELEQARQVARQIVAELENPP